MPPPVFGEPELAYLPRVEWSIIRAEWLAVPKDSSTREPALGAK